MFFFFFWWCFLVIFLMLNIWHGFQCDLYFYPWLVNCLSTGITPCPTSTPSGRFESFYFPSHLHSFKIELKFVWDERNQNNVEKNKIRFSKHGMKAQNDCLQMGVFRHNNNYITHNNNNYCFTHNNNYVIYYYDHDKDKKHSTICAINGPTRRYCMTNGVDWSRYLLCFWWTCTLL